MIALAIISSYLGYPRTAGEYFLADLALVVVAGLRGIVVVISYYFSKERDRVWMVDNLVELKKANHFQLVLVEAAQTSRSPSPELFTRAPYFDWPVSPISLQGFA